MIAAPPPLDGHPSKQGQSVTPHPPRMLLSVHSAALGGAERMALAEAEHLTRCYELVISVPEGPLRPRFAVHGEVVDGTASLPLWGDSAYRWTGRCARTAVQACRLARTIRRTGGSAVLTNSSGSLAPALAGRLARVPVVVHVRDVPESRLAPFVFRLHAALAHTVIVITDRLAPDFERGRARLRIPEASAAAPIEAPRSPRRASTPPHTFADRRHLARKGQDIAIQALARLCVTGLTRHSS